MSRSIHENWRSFSRAQRFEYARETDKAAQRAQRRGGLRRKALIKHLISAERRYAGETALPADPDLIPIRVLDQGPYVHYPAGQDDLRAVMRLLPKGSLDGLHSIDLCLGDRFQVESDDGKQKRDPHTGRICSELLPGVFVGGTYQAMYLAGRARVLVFACVYDPKAPHASLWDVYLRAEMLSSFVHELAHHHDRTRRVARGRWRMDDKVKNERYARFREHAWVQRYIVPYIERAYPEQVTALQSWLYEQTGLPLTLADVLCDPRDGVRDLDAGGCLHCAFSRLIADTQAGRSRAEARIEFARRLRADRRLAEARQIVEQVLADEPSCVEARYLLGWLHHSAGEHGAQQAIAEGLIAQGESGSQVLELLFFAHARQAHWSECIALAEPLLAFPDYDGYDAVLVIQAWAYLRLADVDGCRKNIDLLAQCENPFAAEQAAALLAAVEEHTSETPT